jgi:hypothetical protein
MRAFLLAANITFGYPLFLGAFMSIQILLDRAKHYHHMANEFLRLAGNHSSIESQNYYLQMAEHYRTLGEAAELKINAKSW